MLCDFCHKREAKIVYTVVKEGKKVELHICYECAKARGIDVDYPEKALPFWALPMQKIEAERCERCGLTFEEFKEKLQFGCPECYSTFEKVVEELTSKLQRDTIHKGKVPYLGAIESKKEKEVAELRKKLEQCIKEEKYEEAARIRDKINRLIKEMGNEVA